MAKVRDTNLIEMNISRNENRKNERSARSASARRRKFEPGSKLRPQSRKKRVS